MTIFFIGLSGAPKYAIIWTDKFLSLTGRYLADIATLSVLIGLLLKRLGSGRGEGVEIGMTSLPEP